MMNDMKGIATAMNNELKYQEHLIDKVQTVRDNPETASKIIKLNPAKCAGQNIKQVRVHTILTDISSPLLFSACFSLVSSVLFLPPKNPFQIQPPDHEHTFSSSQETAHASDRLDATNKKLKGMIK